MTGPRPMAGGVRGRAYCQLPPMTMLDPTDDAVDAAPAVAAAAPARAAEAVTAS